MTQIRTSLPYHRIATVTCSMSVRRPVFRLYMQSCQYSLQIVVFMIFCAHFWYEIKLKGVATCHQIIAKVVVRI